MPPMSEHEQDTTFDKGHEPESLSNDKPEHVDESMSGEVERSDVSIAGDNIEPISNDSDESSPVDEEATMRDLEGVDLLNPTDSEPDNVLIRMNGGHIAVEVDGKSPPSEDDILNVEVDPRDTRALQELISAENTRQAAIRRPLYFVDTSTLQILLNALTAELSSR